MAAATLRSLAGPLCRSRGRHCFDALRLVHGRFQSECASPASSSSSSGRPHGGTPLPDLRLLELRRELDRQIVGHEDAKEAVLLGLLAREHVYIEGPPGIGKTQLAEAAAEAAGLSRFFYQFHRDTRVNELVGDATIVREQTADGEVIRQGVRPGGVLTADVCVLDDISRSPGEALNVLLRMLNERKFAGARLPLRCAIATGNPTQEEFFNEPLDPAVLDRFTLQVCTVGLVKGSDWDAAARVVRQYCATSREAFPRPEVSSSEGTGALCAAGWSDYDRRLDAVEFPEDLLETLLKVLEKLVQEHGLGQGHPALLTDRTFLVKAPRVMRARALAEGRACCEEEDLYVLRLMTRFRLPESVHERIGDIIAAVIEERRRQREEPPRGAGAAGAGEGAAARPQEQPQPKGAPAASRQDAAKEQPESDPDSGWSSRVGAALKYLKFFLASVRGAPLPLVNDSYVRIEGAEALIRSLRGSLQRSSADWWQHPGGQPRRYRSMRHLDDAEDAEAAALALWCASPSPALPRTALRQRVERGGAMAIVRDVSDSMSRPRQEYLLARCASSTIRAIVDLARSSHMRVGYAEFGDRSWKHFTGDSGQRFFTRDYPGIQGLARNLATRGSTHYQLALTEVLAEFERLVQAVGFQQRMHVVMLSDGEPTLGCRSLHEERAWAQRLRVCIHTIFIGQGLYPPVLARLAADTGGRRFQAVPFYESGFIRVSDVSHEPVAEQSRWDALVHGWRA